MLAFQFIVKCSNSWPKDRVFLISLAVFKFYGGLVLVFKQSAH